MTEIQELLQIIRDLRAENSALLEIILKKQGLIDTEERIEIPQGVKSVGKLPWYMLQHRLERAAAKPKLSEITGVSDVESSSQSPGSE